MPVFEYRCPHCGHEFEHFWRGMERRAELRCPKCGAEGVEKLISQFGTKSGSSAVGGSAYGGCAPTGG